jgi:hypothetical protein
MKLFVPLSDINHLTGLDSILRAHLSQYFSSIIAPSVPYLTSFLYENGTCANEKVNETYKQILNTNGTGYDFLKFTELQYNPGSNNPSIQL